MDMTTIISEKRYNELLDRLARLRKDWAEIDALAKATDDYDLTNHANAARDRYQAELDKVADVLGVLAGYIHEDVLKRA